MPFAKGAPRPPTSGRKAGSRNKVNATLREKLEAMLDGRPVPMVLAMVGLEARKAGDLALAVKALDAAARYAYPVPAPEAPAEPPPHAPRLLIIE